MKRINERTFEEHKTIGNTAKELAQALFEGAGYSVYPFGYETHFTHIKDLVSKRRLRRNFVLEQLRAMPDLLVVSEDWNDVQLVEVKYRNRQPYELYLAAPTLSRLSKYWPKAILVWVIPFENVFYATSVEALAEAFTIDESQDMFFIPEEFVDPICKIFPRTILNDNEKKLERMKNLAKNLFQNVKT